MDDGSSAAAASASTASATTISNCNAVNHTSPLQVKEVMFATLSNKTINMTNNNTCTSAPLRRTNSSMSRNTARSNTMETSVEGSRSRSTKSISVMSNHTNSDYLDLDLEMESCFGQADLLPFSAQLQLAKTAHMTSKRMRVINQQSERFKDLVVDIRSDLTLFEAVYDNKAVKDAHVRKWPSQIVQQVKNKTSEIQCAVWDDALDRPCHSFSVEDLKHTTTKQLHELVPEYDLIKLVLQCVDGSSPSSMMKLTNGYSDKREANETTNDGLEEAVATASDDQRKPAPGAPVMIQPPPACPFSGIAIDPAMWEAFRQKLAANNHKQQQHLHHHPQVNNQNQTRNKRTSLSSMDESMANALFSSKRTSLTSMEDSIGMDAVFASTSPTYKCITATVPVTKGTIHEEEEEEDETQHDELFIPKTRLPQKTILRLRVINEVTNRAKDMVVQINGTKNLYDDVYNNQAVMEANVRKWGSQIVKDVESKLSEIKVAIYFSPSNSCVAKEGENGPQQHQKHVGNVYTVDQLKKITTQQLYEMMPQHQAESNDPVVLYLFCAKVQQHPSVKTEDSSSNSISTWEGQLSNTISELSTSDSIAHHSFTEPGRDNEKTEDVYPNRIHLQHEISTPLSPPYADVSSCLDSSMNEHSITKKSNVDSTVSEPFSIGPHQLQVKAKSALRVRVVNPTTERFKDIVVGISDTANLYDTIYNHSGVKEAHVQKWGAKIAAEVKSGLSEIQLSVWDDRTGKPWRVFSVAELNSTTTRQLYDELASETSNLITIYMQCTKLTRSEDVIKACSLPPLRHETFHPEFVAPQHSEDTLLPVPSLRLENGRPQFVASISQCKSESFLEKFMARKPARPNHMNLSKRHESFQTLNRSSSLKMTSRALGSPRPRPSVIQTAYFVNSKKKLPAISDQWERREQVEGEKKDLMLNDIDQMLIDFMAIRKQQSPREGPQNAIWKSLVPADSNENGTGPPRTKSMSRATSFGIDQMKPPQLKRRASESSMAPPQLEKPAKTTTQEKIKEFQRLVRGKKTPELQSETVRKGFPPKIITPLVDTSVSSSLNDSIPSVSEAGEENEGKIICASAIASYEKRQARSKHAGCPSNCAPSPQRNSNGEKTIQFLPTCLQSKPSPGQTFQVKGKTSDKISRFLRKQRPPVCLRQPESPAGFLKETTGRASTNALSQTNARSSEPIDLRSSDIPPIKEISVFADDESSPALGVSLSADIVKEIFPYHVALDADFRIIQVGNSLSMIIDETNLIGRFVSDIMAVTSPIPMFGQWDWPTLEKMKDKTIFLESKVASANRKKAKVKGALIEVLKSPKQVMLALFPNVKNLAELEEMNLSMADLPLHSCQREAVLLGEHSKSEVNLTNHLDKLHRDLIDSMEQQIKERTEELAEANRDLEKANAQLAIQAARQLEHFACMSHEIRTPLNCIVGMSSLLLDDAEEMDPMHSDSIRMINTSGDLLKAVVDDVLDYTKLESGSFEVDIKQTNLQHTLDSVAHSISQKIIEKNIRLRTYYSPLLPKYVETDSRRLQQILFNLLGNAGKFSKEDSVIDLTVSLIPVGITRVEAGETSNGHVIRFAVKDYGKGIEEKDFQTIFEPFSQASKETQTVYGGTGLGLSITSKLANRLGGIISLKSDYGKFAEFTVDLPFRGEPVDLRNLQMRLRDTTIVLVEPEEHYDYSFTSMKINEEPNPLPAKISDSFNLNTIRCNSLDSAFEKMTKGGHYALLVQEDLYRPGTLERLDEMLGRLDHTLLTFGPNYSVEQTAGRHFKSLMGLFPSSLLDTIADHIERRKSEKLGSALSIAESKVPHCSLQGNKETINNRENEEKQHPSRGPAPAQNPLFDIKPTQSAGKTHSPAPLFASKPTNAQPSPFFSIQSSSPSPGETSSSPAPLFAVDLSTTTSTPDPLFPISSPPPSGEVSTPSPLFPINPSLPQGGALTPRPIPLFPIQPVSSSGGNSLNKPSGRSLQEGGSFPIAKQNYSPNRDTLPRIIHPTGKVTNPVAKSQSREVQGKAVPPPNRNMKVLYAEDNLVNQKVLSRALTRIGIPETDITIVDNGKKAVDICETVKYDVIFMDIQMPVMGGIEATKIIIERDPRAKVVFVTAHALDEFKAQAKSVGGIGFISKPFGLADIENVLNNLGPAKEPTESPLAAVDQAEQSSCELARTTQSPLPPSKQADVIEGKHYKPVPKKRNLRVLYAEDNAINQKVLSRVLARTGISDVTIVDNGKKAVDLCQSVKYDCIFMDVQMPVMGGVEATKLILEHDPQSCVVFVTAHALDEFRQQVNSLGATNFISKPFRLKDIENLLSTLGLE